MKDEKTPLVPSQRPWFECVHCGRRSRHPFDLAEHYCGFCHHFCDDLDRVNGYALFVDYESAQNP